MKTDPAAGIAGTAGTALSHQAIASGNRAASQINLKSKPKIAISDTVETSDREADGRQDLDSDSTNSAAQPTSQPTSQPGNDETGGQLDLTG